MTEHIDVSKLREVAEAATPGPWATEKKPGGRQNVMEPKRVYSETVREIAEFADDVADTIDAADAEYIATFDPPTVLALLDRLERAEAALERVRAVLATVGALRDSGRYPESANGWLAAITVDVGAALEDQR